MGLAVESFDTIYGVDFSGAKRAGRFIWVAKLEPGDRRAGPANRLASLHRLETLCGTADRDAGLAHLVGLIRDSRRALWGLDFPFGLPVEVIGSADGWDEQLDWVRGWVGGAYALGLECIRRARVLGDRMHIRRATDAEAKAPFDCYHYRIIYQTFHGMRDVVGRLQTAPRTAVLPFQYRKLRTADRVLIESCPASTLKRLGLPHATYKQPAGGPLTRVRLRTRHRILAGLAGRVEISAGHRRVIMRNGGGDALDAVIAAVGAAIGWAAADHRLIARHPRYPREGRIYV